VGYQALFKSYVLTARLVRPNRLSNYSQGLVFRSATELVSGGARPQTPVGFCKSPKAQCNDHLVFRWIGIPYIVVGASPFYNVVYSLGSDAVIAMRHTYLQKDRGVR